jgi:WD40 repeat protein
MFCQHLSCMACVCRHLLVTGSCDASAKLWDLRTCRTLTRFPHPNHFEEVRSVQLNGHDGLVTGCYDGVVREYELSSGRLKVSGGGGSL